MKRRRSGFWQIDVGPWIVSFKPGWYCVGYRHVPPALWTFSLPFVLFQVIRRRVTRP